MRSPALGVFALAIFAASSALAEDPPAASEVVITGKRPDVVDRVDRRTYDIENDPQSQTGSAPDILKKLPSVNVSPSGDISLRGDSGVTVMVDGKPVSDRSLQRMPANQIGSIEVMTNPSAQYAADGASGIINIITRKKRPPGLSGGANTAFDSHGSGDGGFSLNLGAGKWTFKAALSGGRWQGRQRGASRQETLDALGVVTSVLDLQSGSHNRFDYADAELSAGYRLTDHATLTLTARFGVDDFSSDAQNIFSGSAALGGFTETNTARGSPRNSSIDLTYAFNGEKNGETLTLQAQHADGRGGDDSTLVTDYVSPLLPTATSRFLGDARDLTDLIKGDYSRGFSGRTLLTAGFSWKRASTHRFRSAASSDPAFPAFVNDFAGVETTTDLYATYQFPLGKWTLLPGLRLEWVGRSFASGAPGSDEFIAFPTLHINRDLGQKAKLKASYTRRVDRVDLTTYDTTLIYSSPRSAFAGNPILKPQTADSYEVSYHYDDKGFGLVGSLYYRVRHDTFDVLRTDIGGGVIVSSFVNNGERRTGGAEFTVHGTLDGAPAEAHWKYNLNANLFYVRLQPLAPGQGQRDATSWSGKATLSYDAKPGGRGGDQWQLNVQAGGPQIRGGGSSDGYVQVDASYRHPIGPRWALTLSATDILNSTGSHSETFSPTVRSTADQEPSARAVKIGLSWKFGGS